MMQIKKKDINFSLTMKFYWIKKYYFTFVSNNHNIMLCFKLDNKSIKSLILKPTDTIAFFDFTTFKLSTYLSYN